MKPSNWRNYSTREEVAKNLRDGRRYVKPGQSHIKQIIISLDPPWGEYSWEWAQITHYEGTAMDAKLILDEEEAIDRIIGMNFRLDPEGGK